MSTKNSETNETRRFRVSLVDKLNLKDPNKNMVDKNQVNKQDLKHQC